MRWVGYVACMGEGRGACGVLAWKSQGQRPLGRPRCRWEDNIKKGLPDFICVYITNYLHFFTMFLSF